MAEKKCILIIDDDKNVCQIIKARFEALGYRVLIAYEGAEGLTKTETEKPDCVLLDILIPKGESGLTYLRKIRSYQHDDLKEQTRVRGIPVIVLTATGMGMKTLFELEGISGFIEKPFQVASLHAKIQKILE
jgi:CheY-like chemotaxis protein